MNIGLWKINKYAYCYSLLGFKNKVCKAYLSAIHLVRNQLIPVLVSFENSEWTWHIQEVLQLCFELNSKFNMLTYWYLASV